MINAVISVEKAHDSFPPHYENAADEVKVKPWHANRGGEKAMIRS